MKSFRFALYCCLLVSCAGLVRADEASKAARIEEMLALTHAERIADQMMAQMRPMMDAQLKKLNLPEDQKPAIDEMQAHMLEWLSSRLNWQKMKPIYVKIYAETLTEEEVAGAVEFYKTPAGQALLNKMPVLMQRSMAIVQDMMTDLIPEMTRITEDVAKKYKK